MPFYEYSCTACGAETEVLQRLSDPPEVECPVCHAQALVKQVSAAGFRLKGGGWYETDFKSGDKRNLVGEAAGGDPAASAENKSDQKSEPAEAKAASTSQESASGKSESAPAKTSDAPSKTPPTPKLSESSATSPASKSAPQSASKSASKSDTKAGSKASPGKTPA